MKIPEAILCQFNTAVRVGTFILCGFTFLFLVMPYREPTPAENLIVANEEIPHFPEDVPFATLLTAAEPSGQRASWKILYCSNTDMKQIIIQIPQRHIDSGWVKVEFTPADDAVSIPNPDTLDLLKYCCEPPYPKDWAYCPYCGTHLRHNRFERHLLRLENDPDYARRWEAVEERLERERGEE